MRDPRRKFLSLGNHFFERLKTADSSTACGTSTLKSLLSLGPDAPHVHLRLRKRLSRCTLDCGFKTSESPALRGFKAERGPITGTSLYLVPKSNGLHRPKIRLKKFGFSLKTVPADIAKKLPPQCCSKSLFISFFNFSHKRPTLAFSGKNGHTLGSRRKIAHSGSHAETGGVLDGGGITTLGALCVLSKRRTTACQKGSFAVFWGRVSTIDSRGAKAETASHAEQPRFPVKGTGAVFCVTSYSDTGTRRSALLCRCRWGRNDRCLRRW